MQRNQKKQAMRQKIFDAAIKLFDERGLEDVTLGEIASAANVSTRTLYRYFPKKSDIHGEFILNGLNSLREFSRQLPKDISLLECIVEMMLYDYRNMFGQFSPNFFIHPRRDTEGLTARYEMKALQVTESIYFGILKEKQAEKGIVPSDKTNLAAETIFAIYRHSADMLRFKFPGQEDDVFVGSYFRRRLMLVWPSIEENLFQTNRSN